MSYGRWFVTNTTTEPIVLRTDPSVQLLVTQIAPGETRAIKAVSEGSGGHVRPSNFIQTFSVESGGKTIYEGVRNADWEDAGALCGHQRFVLVVR